MRLRTPTALLLSSLLLSQGSLAIFADEAYHLDFHHALLGLPQAHTTFLHRPSADSKASLLYTLSENGILGAVNPKDGAILWRQRPGEEGQDYKRRSLLKASAGSNAIASILDDKVQVWDAVDGRLWWSWQAPGTTKAVEIVVQKNETVLVITGQDGTNGFVRCFSVETGAFQWNYQDYSGDTPYSLVFAEGRLFYVALHAAMLKGYKIKATELDMTKGDKKGQPYLFASESEVSTEDSILFLGVIGNLPMIVWSDKTFRTIKVGSILHSHTTSLGPALGSRRTIEGVKVHASSDPRSNPRFLLHFQESKSHWATVYDVDTSTGQVTIAHDLQSIEGRGAFAVSSQGPDVHFVRHTPSEISLTSSAAATVLHTWKIPAKPDAKETELRAISHVVVEVASRDSSKFSVRSVLALESGDWEMLRNGESSWIKNEGITGIVAASFAAVAGDEEYAQNLRIEGQYNVVSAYIYRLKRHLRDLQSLPFWIEAQYNQLSGRVAGSDESSQRTEVLRDKFGFSQIIIVATKHGRLAALDTGKNGRVIWSVQVVSLEPGTVWDVLSIDVEADTVLVRASKGERVRIVTSTGMIVHHQHGELIEGLSSTIPVQNVRGQQTLLPINNDGSLGQIPNVEFGDGIVVVTEDAGHKLTGWSLSQNQKSTLAWTFLPYSGYTITQVVHRPAHDPVASIGKVLGDRNVLYKYLNPNIVLVTSENKVTSSVSFFLLDSVFGDVLHSITHSGVDLAKPVSSAISENTFVYALFSTSLSKDPHQPEPEEISGYQLSVSELFESLFPNDRGPLSQSSNFSTGSPLNVGEDDVDSSLHVATQTFLVPEAISQLYFTSTLQGITPRSLLCIAPRSNSIVSIPRHILDPRRPVGREPTSAEFEEGLFRYNAVLEFDPKWYLNHKRESLGFSNVITTPSLLESTSLVFAYGDADMFGTRISPIGGFDILGKGFSKFQLVATVAALAVGTGILAPLVRKKQIDGTWKG